MAAVCECWLSKFLNVLICVITNDIEIHAHALL